MKHLVSTLLALWVLACSIAAKNFMEQAPALHSCCVHLILAQNMFISVAFIGVGAIIRTEKQPDALPHFWLVMLLVAAFINIQSAIVWYAV